MGEAAEGDGPRDLTFSDLDRHTGYLAQELERLGVGVGDRVVVQVDKSLAAVVLYVAILRRGAVFVPLNVAYTANEVAYFVEDAQPVLAVCSSRTVNGVTEVGARCGVPVVCLTGQSGSNARRVLDGNSGRVMLKNEYCGDSERTCSMLRAFAPNSATGSGLAEHESDGGGAWDVCPRGAEDLAAILYTSGTTGRSKGAMLTHGNLCSNALTLRSIWGFSDHDVLLHVLPIFHVHGLFVALNVALCSGAQVLFFEVFDAQRTVELLPEATVLMGVPTHYSRLLAEDLLTKDQCSNMRLFTSGSAPLDPARFQEFEDRTGHRILERYGMTEAGMITSNPYHHASKLEASDFPAGERLPGTVGFPLPGVEVEICDEAGRPVDEGDVGILRVRGPNVFSGYWRLPGKTAETMASGGWLISGDLAQQDTEGRVTLVGRSSDMMIVGGYNVYPREIEDCLLTLDGIAEVAVFGVPHADLGEGVVACMVAREEPLADDALQEVMVRDLANFKRPRRLVWLEDLPRNAMGKVQKAVLRQQFAESYVPK